MSETIEVTDTPTGGKKVSVSFTRKLSDGNYGGWDCTAWVEGEYPAGASAADVATAAGNLFTAAKAAVLDELGIEWALDESGSVRETVTPFVSTPHAAAAVNRVMGGTTSDGGSGGNVQDGIRIMNWGKDDVSTDPVPAKVIGQVKKDGITAIWDQRHTATGRQPQFKEAVPRGEQGHGKDGQAKGYWAD